MGWKKYVKVRLLIWMGWKKYTKNHIINANVMEVYAHQRLGFKSVFILEHFNLSYIVCIYSKFIYIYSE